MELRVTTTNGSVMNFTLNPNETSVIELKEMIRDKSGLATDRCRLVWVDDSLCRNALADYDILSSYGINCGDVIESTPLQQHWKPQRPRKIL